MTQINFRSWKLKSLNFCYSSTVEKGSVDVSIVCVSPVSNPSPSNVLEKLHYMQHKVYGDGNCLYHAHQPGFIKQNCHGDTFVARQLRILASQCMQEFPDVCLAYKGSVGDKKDTHFAVRMGRGFLLAIAICREIVVITGSGSTFTSALAVHHWYQKWEVEFLFLLK